VIISNPALMMVISYNTLNKKTVANPRKIEENNKEIVATG